MNVTVISRCGCRSNEHGVISDQSLERDMKNRSQDRAEMSVSHTSRASTGVASVENEIQSICLLMPNTLHEGEPGNTTCDSRLTEDDWPQYLAYRDA